ncbi:MAG: desulfoferrodoxin [Candidatus Cloacimonetes bacterium]|nr:desulfoferrodoxin [Candidatus Cloacimonadota bacterium]
MTKLRDIYRCNICGNVIEITAEGAEALVCCGKPMGKFETKTVDAATEKHVPYIEETKNGVLVKVGQNQEHPMLENHFIMFVEVLTENQVLRAELKPGDKPQAEFTVSRNEIVLVREFCNLHGLWKN